MAIRNVRTGLPQKHAQKHTQISTPALMLWNTAKTNSKTYTNVKLRSCREVSDGIIACKSLASPI